MTDSVVKDNFFTGTHVPYGETVKEILDNPINHTDGFPNVHYLSVLYEYASKEARPEDNLAGNPMMWGSTKGVLAVREAMIRSFNHRDSEL